MAHARALDRRRPLVWATAVVLVTLSATQLYAASIGDPLHNPIALVWGALGIAGLLTAARYVAVQCFESRLAMVLIGAGTLLAVLLLHTIGAPGLPASAWTARDVVLVALSAALLASWRVTARAPRR